MNKDGLEKAFASASRLKLMSCLLSGKKNVGDIVSNCGLSQSATSQHLAYLRELDLVACEKRGREKIYVLKSKEVGNIAKQIIKLINKN
jgi:DNA-binding transcriptional ArsR family regulator